MTELDAQAVSAVTWAMPLASIDSACTRNTSLIVLSFHFVGRQGLWIHRKHEAMKQFFGHIPEAVKGPQMDGIKMGLAEAKSGVAWQTNQQDDGMIRMD